MNSHSKVRKLLSNNIKHNVYGTPVISFKPESFKELCESLNTLTVDISTVTDEELFAELTNRFNSHLLIVDADAPKVGQVYNFWRGHGSTSELLGLAQWIQIALMEHFSSADD